MNLFRLFTSLVFMFVLSGCGSTIVIGGDSFQLQKQYRERKVNLYVGTKEYIQTFCSNLTLETTAIACSMFNEKECTIYVEENLSYEVFGHELRHCFDGDFHAKGVRK